MSTSASVISLHAFRATRRPAAGRAPGASAPTDTSTPDHPDAVEVLEVMIECYFTALRTQLDSIKEQRS